MGNKYSETKYDKLRNRLIIMRNNYPPMKDNYDNLLWQYLSWCHVCGLDLSTKHDKVIK